MRSQLAISTALPHTADSPDEPRPTICDSPVLLPSTEVVPAAHALPARPHDGEVVLASEELFLLTPESIAEVRLVDVPVVKPKAFLRVPDGLGVDVQAALGEHERVGEGGDDHVQRLAERVGRVL